MYWRVQLNFEAASDCVTLSFPSKSLRRDANFRLVIIVGFLPEPDFHFIEIPFSCLLMMSWIVDLGTPSAWKCLTTSCLAQSGGRSMRSPTRSRSVSCLDIFALIHVHDKLTQNRTGLLRIRRGMRKNNFRVKKNSSRARKSKMKPGFPVATRYLDCEKRSRC